MMSLPRWVILHVPHDATCIPPEVRGQFALDLYRWLEQSGNACQLRPRHWPYEQRGRLIR